MSIFTKVQMQKVNSSTFDLSHQRKFSMQLGKIVPCMLIETLPGDVFTCQTAQLVRFVPMIAPLMHQVSLYTHFFYVPNRILWENWKIFITGGEDGEQEPLFPTFDVPGGTFDPGDLPDYMGLPIDINTGDQIVPVDGCSALPFAAYQRVYNEFYRDQNLIAKVVDECVDGNANDVQMQGIRRRAWQHDYFTSALPWTQRGPQVTIPLGTSAPVTLDNQALPGQQYRDSAGALVGASTGINIAASSIPFMASAPNSNLFLDPNGTMVADLSTATASTIVDLRNAFRLQEWLEKNARGGARYNEAIMSHFGVHTGDALVDRPIFLGGGSQPISISEVLQTSSTGQTGAATPQGNMAGHGISSGQSSSWRYKCKEHGFIIGLVTIMPKTAYQQGLPKFYKKTDKFDYAFPTFAHIGEQPITDGEVFWENSANDETVFGYTPRYAEYKYMNDTVHGEFTTSLDFWHWGRRFATRPTLNQTFIECNPSTRIFAVEDGEHCYVHMYHQVRAKRKLPFFGNPKI